MYFAQTTDQGDTYTTVWNDNAGEYRLDWLANRSYVEEGKAQIRSTPDGSKFYGSYVSESEEGMVDPTSHFHGSDIWFRKVEWPEEEIVEFGGWR